MPGTGDTRQRSVNAQCNSCSSTSTNIHRSGRRSARSLRSPTSIERPCVSGSVGPRPTADVDRPHNRRAPGDEGPRTRGQGAAKVSQAVREVGGFRAHIEDDDLILEYDLPGPDGAAVWERQAGYEIPQITQVGRKFGMPGGGSEMYFPYSIPPEFLKVVSP